MVHPAHRLIILRWINGQTWSLLFCSLVCSGFYQRLQGTGKGQKSRICHLYSHLVKQGYLEGEEMYMESKSFPGIKLLKVAYSIYCERQMKPILYPNGLLKKLNSVITSKTFPGLCNNFNEVIF